jgi:hypothetical protein
MFRVIGSTSCRGGNCPTVLLDDETGEVLVQGYEPGTAELAEVGAPPLGEAVARIPVALLLEAARTVEGGPR